MTMQATKATPLVVEASRRNGFVDLTDELVAAVSKAEVHEGFAIAFTAHTTCALAINEWEDGIQHDFDEVIESLVPKARDYLHDDFERRTQNLTDDERTNGASHMAALMIGNTSQIVPVVGGEPALGRWQRLILVELDEPKPRSVFFVVAST
jgi:secondary thiamine-phosphate synthase enzyme